MEYTNVYWLCFTYRILRTRERTVQHMHVAHHRMPYKYAVKGKSHITVFLDCTYEDIVVIVYK